MAETTGRGELLPDSLVLTLLRKRLQAGAATGERGVLLDGFPRTRAQAACRSRSPLLAASHPPARRSCWTQSWTCSTR